MTTLHSTEKHELDPDLEKGRSLEPRYVDEPYADEDQPDMVLDPAALPLAGEDQEDEDSEEEVKEDEEPKKSVENPLSIAETRPSPSTRVRPVLDRPAAEPRPNHPVVEAVDEAWTDPSPKPAPARDKRVRPIKRSPRKAKGLPVDPIGPPPSPAIKAYQAQVSQWAEAQSPAKADRTPRPRPTYRPAPAKRPSIDAPIQLHKMAPKPRPDQDERPEYLPTESARIEQEDRPEITSGDPELPPFMQTKYKGTPLRTDAAELSQGTTRPSRISPPPVAPTANKSAPAPAVAESFDLEQVIATHQPLPNGSMILGVGQDGRPLLLEFSDPSTGDILILGESAEHNRRHMQSLLASVRMLNVEDPAEIHVITAEPAQFARRTTGMQLVRPDHEATFELLGQLFEVAEQRMQAANSPSQKLLSTLERLKQDLLHTPPAPSPKPPGPVHILAIDQIDLLISQMAPESLSFLRWLLRKGPEANIWILATLSTQCSELDWKTIRSFGLTLVGQIEHSQPAARISRIPAALQRSLRAGKEACLELDGEVIRFSILDFQAA
jgi:hypothetical protein